MDEFKRVTSTVLVEPDPSGEPESPEDFSMINRDRLEQLLTTTPNVTLTHCAFKFGVTNAKMTRYIQWTYKENFIPVRNNFHNILKEKVYSRIADMGINQGNERCLIYLAEKLFNTEKDVGSGVIPLAYVPLSQREKKNVGN